MSDEASQEKRKSRLARLKAARNHQPSKLERIISAGVAGFVAVVVVFALLSFVGVFVLEWQLISVFGVMGMVSGAYWGAVAAPHGMAAGVFAGLSVFLYIIFTALVFFIEAIGVILAALLSGFSA